MISFIVTGFGPFHGVPENPTMTLAQSLIGYIQRQETRGGVADVDIPAPTSTGTIVLQYRYHNGYEHWS